jgi:hypothetical protein
MGIPVQRTPPALHQSPQTQIPNQTQGFQISDHDSPASAFLPVLGFWSTQRQDVLGSFVLRRLPVLERI